MSEEYREYTRKTLAELRLFAASEFDAETMVKALENLTSNLRRRADLPDDPDPLERTGCYRVW